MRNTSKYCAAHTDQFLIWSELFHGFTPDTSMSDKGPVINYGEGGGGTSQREGGK